MKCPLCKHEPKYNKNGKIRKGHIGFETITVTHDFRDDYSSSRSFIALCCPICGILFKTPEREEN